MQRKAKETMKNIPRFGDLGAIFFATLHALSLLGYGQHTTYLFFAS